MHSVNGHTETEYSAQILNQAVLKLLVGNEATKLPSPSVKGIGALSIHNRLSTILYPPETFLSSLPLVVPDVREVIWLSSCSQSAHIFLMCHIEFRYRGKYLQDGNITQI